MSIEDELNRLEGSALWRIESEFFGEESPRFVYVSTDVFQFVLANDDEEVDLGLARNSKALLDDFIEGAHITVGWRPFNKKSTCILARTDPVENDIWDFRCLDPRPGVRILGAFAMFDVFVALTWDYRENFDDNWPEKIKECVDMWVHLFGAWPRHKGRSINEYISDPVSIV